jgi:hypothetical protein
MEFEDQPRTSAPSTGNLDPEICSLLGLLEEETGIDFELVAF